MPKVLAALASQPRREALLARVLETLRPQVDDLRVYLNGYARVPACVEQLADRYELGADDRGAERKFWWSEDAGVELYFTCDDDILYPPDYVATMQAALEQHPGALVSAHGRTYLGRPASVHHVSGGTVGIFHKRVDVGRWVNHAGTGVLAWDARSVRVPARWPAENIADMQLAVWAQNAGVPIWLIPHQAGWLSSPALHDPQALFARSRVEGHARRSELLREQGRRAPWRLHNPPDA